MMALQYEPEFEFSNDDFDLDYQDDSNTFLMDDDMMVFEEEYPSPEDWAEI